MLEDQETNHKSNVLFFSSDFSKLKMKNVYKALNLVKPDIILLQLRPDQVLSNFKTDLLKQDINKDWVLNEKLYFQQIVRDPIDIYPNFVMRKII